MSWGEKARIINILDEAFMKVEKVSNTPVSRNITVTSKGLQTACVLFCLLHLLLPWSHWFKVNFNHSTLFIRCFLYKLFIQRVHKAVYTKKWNYLFGTKSELSFMVSTVKNRDNPVLSCPACRAASCWNGCNSNLSTPRSWKWLLRRHLSHSSA